MHLDESTLGYLIIAIILFFIGQRVALWYFKIDDIITQQHETNRLLRKLAGEPTIESFYLKAARKKGHYLVSSEANAEPKENTELSQ